MRVLVFWLQAVCKTVLRPFFHWNLQAFSKAELVFKESFTFFGARHLAVDIFVGAKIDFP